MDKTKMGSVRGSIALFWSEPIFDNFPKYGGFLPTQFAEDPIFQ
jgi:hypothetical protein